MPQPDPPHSDQCREDGSFPLCLQGTARKGDELLDFLSPVGSDSHSVLVDTSSNFWSDNCFKTLKVIAHIVLVLCTTKCLEDWQKKDERQGCATFDPVQKLSSYPEP